MITMKRGDTQPPLSITLTDNGAVVDLSTATIIKVKASRNESLLFSRATTGTTLGVVTMPWQATDTALPGILQIEVEVTWPDGGILTFPADGVLRVNITPDLDTQPTDTPQPLAAYGLTEDPTHPGLYLIGS